MNPWRYLVHLVRFRPGPYLLIGNFVTQYRQTGVSLERLDELLLDHS